MRFMGNPLRNVVNLEDYVTDTNRTEREGFEPSVRFRTSDFKSDAFDHSATSPIMEI